jgi:hypothetical protein
MTVGKLDGPLALTKSPQIRMIAFALEGWEELDLRGFEAASYGSQRSFDIAGSQNHVVEHCSDQSR